MIKLLEKMDEIENEIINSTKEFAAFNNIHFDELTKSMVLNAIRETKALHKHKRMENNDKVSEACINTDVSNSANTCKHCGRKNDSCYLPHLCPSRCC